MWPIGILLVILLGVILIIVSIRISTIQSIDTDHTFGLKKDILDKDINYIMRKQNLFSSFYNVRINSTEPHDIKNSVIIENPYYISPVPKDVLGGNTTLMNDKKIFLYLENKKTDLIGNSADIKDISLEFVRLVQGEKEVTSLTIPMEKINTNVYRARDFLLPLDGYYQARFKIVVNFDNEPKESKDYPIYFYQWIFNTNSKIENTSLH